jgi:hypothetical protein
VSASWESKLKQRKLPLPTFLPGLGVTQAIWGSLNQFKFGWLLPNTICIQVKLGQELGKVFANQVKLGCRTTKLNLQDCLTNAILFIGWHPCN